MPLEAQGQGFFDSSVPADVLKIQLQDLLTSRYFSTGKRSSSMLQYIVEHAIECDTGSLKERTIGIEVFERVADDDTSLDAVVRNAAPEIRKQLALYYSGNAGAITDPKLPLANAPSGRWVVHGRRLQCAGVAVKKEGCAPE